MKEPRGLTRFLPKASLLLGNKARFFATLREGYKLIIGKKKFSDIKDDALDLFNLAKASYKGEYRGLGKKNLLLIVAALLYLVAPIDLIPDFVLGLGFTDDLAILTYLIGKLYNEIESYRLWSRGRQNPS